MTMSRFVLHGGGRAYLATGGDISIFIRGNVFLGAISYFGQNMKKTTSYHAKVTLVTLTPTGQLTLQTNTLLTALMSARLSQHLAHIDVDTSAIMMTMI